MARFRHRSTAGLLLAVVFSGPALAQNGGFPESVAPSPAVLEAVTAPYLTDGERKDFRVLHGVEHEVRAQSRHQDATDKREPILETRGC